LRHDAVYGHALGVVVDRGMNDVADRDAQERVRGDYRENRRSSLSSRTSQTCSLTSIRLELQT
jgi:hypothetical protein